MRMILSQNLLILVKLRDLVQTALKLSQKSATSTSPESIDDANDLSPIIGKSSAIQQLKGTIYKASPKSGAGIHLWGIGYR